jgi:hypothetical protein
LQATEQGQALVIEKVFDFLPPDVQYLKNRCYGRGNLYIAWKSLQTDDRECKLAIHFQQQAIKHYPQLRYSFEYIRLSLAIVMKLCLKTDSYHQFLTIFYSLRRYITFSNND